MKNKNFLTIGIWLELGIGSPFSHEGLTRLLFFIAEGMSKDDIKFLLTAPSWMEIEIRNALLNLREVDREKFDVFIPVSKPPISLKLLNILWKRKNERKSHWRQRLNLKLKKISEYFLRIIVSRRSFLELLIYSIIFLPMTFFVSAFSLLYFKVGKINGFVRGYTLAGIDFLKKFHGSIYAVALQAEFDAMARNANNNNNIDCWFILNPFSTTSGRLLKAPVVALVADFVPIACPGGFSPASVEVYRKRLFELDPVVTKYITISKHVAQYQLRNHLGIKEDRIATIHHGAVCLKKDLNFEFESIKNLETRIAAASIIRDYVLNRDFYESHLSVEWLDATWDKYLANFPFENAKFVMVSTQNRSYKNTLSVIKAVELLIKYRGYGVKLIMTGVLDDEMQRYVRDNSLYFDIISIPRVPNSVLAALYHCATVAVHASFFEGGIGAFPFYEAISVGTPAILSRNAASMELTTDERYHDFLFDPYSIEELADRIEFVSENSEATFNWQHELYKEVAKRSWLHASTEYLDVFRSAIKLREL